jgi:uracil-DNA glycosylase
MGLVSRGMLSGKLVMEDKRYLALKQIRDEVLALKSSPLFQYRTENKYFPVIGEGSHYAQIMFVGEAPGRNEAEKGRPFCGAAGRILDGLLEEAKLKRKDVYITNIIKDRPPGNRDPLPEEIELYAPFLKRQIDIIKPPLIATLGRFSMAFVMQEYGLEKELKSISQIHGRRFEAKLSYGKVSIIPLYHPAVAIYKAAMKEALTKDFLKLKEL